MADPEDCSFFNAPIMGGDILSSLSNRFDPGPPSSPRQRWLPAFHLFGFGYHPPFDRAGGAWVKTGLESGRFISSHVTAIRTFSVPGFFFFGSGPRVSSPCRHERTHRREVVSRGLPTERRRSYELRLREVPPLLEDVLSRWKD